MEPEAFEATIRRPLAGTPGYLPVAVDDNAGGGAFMGKCLDQNAGVVFVSFSKL